jgi:hypothetical protein
MWGWLVVAAIIVSPVVLLCCGVFPAFVLLAAAVLGVYIMGGLSTFDDAETLMKLERRLEALESRHAGED